jgi:hypothetical protein
VLCIGTAYPSALLAKGSRPFCESTLRPEAGQCLARYRLPLAIDYNLIMADLFAPVVPEAQLSESFKMVARSSGYAPARTAMREAFAKMGQRDANFLEQFQTGGFDARVFELYLFSAFAAAGLRVDAVGDSPDFLVYGHGCEWAVEATTANPSQMAKPRSSAT